MNTSLFDHVKPLSFVRMISGSLALAAVLCGIAPELRAGSQTFNSVDTTGDDGNGNGLHVEGDNATIDNNLNVGGQAYFSQNIQLGDNFQINSFPSSYGFSGSSATVFFQQPDHATWLWQANPSYPSYYNSSGWETQMTLSAGDALTLGDPTTSSNITIDPVGQTITFGDGLVIGETTTTLFQGSVADSYLFGDGTANATYAIAMGPSSVASNTNALALVNATASGANSIAMGGSSTKATGSYAMALGAYSTASGDYSLTFGDTDTIASGTGAIALGTDVTAQAWSSVTVGHYNLAPAYLGSATSINSKDPAFIVGIGSGSGATPTANGLVVLNNGIIYSGTGNTTDSPTNMILGNGLYMEIVPQNGIFLAGNFTSADVAMSSYTGDVGIGYNIKIAGAQAVAIGYGVWANSGGVAMGYEAVGESSGSVGIGLLSDADVLGDVSLGFENVAASGYGSVALGIGNGAWDAGASSIGYENTVTGIFAIGLGGENTVSGGNSTAIGGINNISADTSSAIGFRDNVTGTGAVALGANLTTSYNNVLVAGSWNKETAGLTGGNQPLFELGNGTASANSTAFEVTQNGNAIINGTLTVSGGLTLGAALGDIPMGQYGSP